MGIYATVAEHVQARPWVLLWAFAVGFMTRATKPDSRGPTLPSFLRAPLAISLGLFGGVLEHFATGIAWGPALDGGLSAGLYAILGHVAIVDTLRKGSEVALPPAMMRKPKPATVKVPDGEERDPHEAPGQAPGGDP